VQPTAREAGAHRASRDAAIARVLAERATIHPEGYALVTPGPIDPDSLAALLRMVAGAEFLSSIARVAALARSPGRDTLGGVRIAPAGRLGLGWLLVREQRAMAPPVTARPNAVWDGRFRLIGHPPDNFPPGLQLGALDADAVRFRDRTGLPSLVLRTLPALRLHGTPIAIPHIGIGDPRWRLIFCPRNVAISVPFMSG
jgi:tRNA(Ile)-lysidine synthase